MEFQTEVQKTVYEKVSVWMREMFGEMTMMSTQRPEFALRMGSAMVRINVRPWGDDDAIVSSVCWVVTGAEKTPALLEYLLRQNNLMRFGAFSIDQEGDIFFDYAIVGSTCDKIELKTAVMAVLTTADDLDDEIVSRFGGEPSLRRMQRG
jgi:hypothetical protein